MHAGRGAPEQDACCASLNGFNKTFKLSLTGAVDLQDPYASDQPSSSYYEEGPDAGYSGRDSLLDVEVESDNGYYSQGDQTGVRQQTGRGQEYTNGEAGNGRRAGSERWSPSVDTSSQDDWD
jgi:hypothetical protein